MNQTMKNIFDHFIHYTDQEIAGNPPYKYILAAVVLVVSYIVLRILFSFVLKQLKKLTSENHVIWDDLVTGLVSKNAFLLIGSASLYFSVHCFEFTSRLEQPLNIFFAFILSVVFLRVTQSVLKCWFAVKYFNQEKVDIAKKSVMKNMLLFTRLLLWLLVILLFLDNLGFNITTMIAGLGIGGVAVALAAQSILSDIFSYFIIFFDKPFEVGDFITVGEYLGVVEHIGIKTTRVRSLQGEQFVFGNTDLIASRIQNFKKMQKRRVLHTLGIIYETTPEKMRRIPGIIKEAVTSTENARFDRAHFRSYGAYSLDFEYVYFVESADYNTFMDVQQTINYKIFDLFAKEKVEFAYPTKMLHVKNL